MKKILILILIYFNLNLAFAEPSLEDTNKLIELLKYHKLSANGENIRALGYLVNDSFYLTRSGRRVLRSLIDNFSVSSMFENISLYDNYHFWEKDSKWVGEQFIDKIIPKDTKTEKIVIDKNQLGELLIKFGLTPSYDIDKDITKLKSDVSPVIIDIFDNLKILYASHNENFHNEHPNLPNLPTKSISTFLGFATFLVDEGSYSSTLELFKNMANKGNNDPLNENNYKEITDSVSRAISQKFYNENLPELKDGNISKPNQLEMRTSVSGDNEFTNRELKPVQSEANKLNDETASTFIIENPHLAQQDIHNLPNNSNLPIIPEVSDSSSDEEKNSKFSEIRK